MDPLRFGQSVARVARARLTRRAALASSGAGLASALLDRFDWNARVAAAQDATPTGTVSTGDNEPPEVPAWMQTPGAPASAYGERAPAEESVVRWSPAPDVSFSPLADLHGTLTPNALFYEVHYGGIPAIDPAEHRLMVHGLVERPTLFTMDDLKRFPSVSVIHFLECSGNSFFEWQEGSGGETVQQTAGLDQLRRVDGGTGRHRPARGRDQTGRHLDAGRRRRCRGARPQHPGGKGDARRTAGLRRQRRGPAAVSGLSRAPAAARLRGQHQRQVAAPPEDRRPSRGTPGRRPATTAI